MVESSVESVRIPKGLADFIDTNFVDKGLFSSRADFVSTAIRYYYENDVYLFARYAQTAVELKKQNAPGSEQYKTSLSLVKMMFLNRERSFRISMFGGDNVTVLLRMPPLLVRNYTRFINETGIYRKKSEFYNSALEFYLDVQQYVLQIESYTHSRDAKGLFSTLDGEEKYVGSTTLALSIDRVSKEWDIYETKDTDKEDWLDGE